MVKIKTVSERPSWRFLFAHPAHFIACGLGSGLSPWAPGTVGTLFAWATFPLLRLAPFPEAVRYLVGPMCCTPERGGLEVVFSQFSHGPAQQKDLHDLS